MQDLVHRSIVEKTYGTLYNFLKNCVSKDEDEWDLNEDYHA